MSQFEQLLDELKASRALVVRVEVAEREEIVGSYRI